MILAVFTSSFLFGVVSAHELVADQDPYKWSIIVNGRADLKINGDLLNSEYSSYFNIVAYTWPSFSSKVATSIESFSYSNVDFCAASTSWWNNQFQDPWVRQDVLAITLSSTYNSYGINYITYSPIYMTPYTDNFNYMPDGITKHGDPQGHKVKTMVHEIGHVLGLGHSDRYNYNPLPAEVTSIMRNGYVPYTWPQAHDIDDLANKY